MSIHIHAQTCQVKLRDCFMYLCNPQPGDCFTPLCVDVCERSSVSVSAFARMSACTGAPCFGVHVCSCVFASKITSHLPPSRRVQLVCRHLPTPNTSKNKRAHLQVEFRIKGGRGAQTGGAAGVLHRHDRPPLFHRSSEPHCQTPQRCR